MNRRLRTAVAVLAMSVTFTACTWQRTTWIDYTPDKQDETPTTIVHEPTCMRWPEGC